MFVKRIGAIVTFLGLICCGCVRPRIQPWRLVKGDTTQVLVPPDVAKPELEQRTLKVRITPGNLPCPAGIGGIAIKERGKRLTLNVVTQSLRRQSAGGLAIWASEMEGTHCLAPGDGLKLADRIAESVPLDPALAFLLLHPDSRDTGEVDLGPPTRLQVVSPYWREAGRGMIDGPMAVAADSRNDRRLIVTANSTENLVGEETTLYALRPRGNQPGSTITPLYADVHIPAETGPTTERRPQPAINYLKFPDAAAYYRLFYKSSETGFTALIVAGRTPAELDQRTKTPGSERRCRLRREAHQRDVASAIPKDVAVNSMVAVTVNGAEVLVVRGAWIAWAIMAAGERQPNTILRSLSISKPWNGRSIPVAFDHGDSAILSMPLGGGEIISWR